MKIVIHSTTAPMVEDYDAIEAIRDALAPLGYRVWKIDLHPAGDSGSGSIGRQWAIPADEIVRSADEMNRAQDAGGDPDWLAKRRFMIE